MGGSMVGLAWSHGSQVVVGDGVGEGAVWDGAGLEPHWQPA